MVTDKTIEEEEHDRTRQRKYISNLVSRFQQKVILNKDGTQKLPGVPGPPDDSGSL